MVVGLSGVGMAALLTALALGHCEVIGVDALPEKLDRARAAGATSHSPRQRAFETAVTATAPGGITVPVGLPGPDARSAVSPLHLVAGARTIVGSYLGSAADPKHRRQETLPRNRATVRLPPDRPAIVGAAARRHRTSRASSGHCHRT